MDTSNPKNSYIETNSIEAPESDYLYIQNSQLPNAGLGLFTAIDLYKNEVITLFTGEIIDNTEAQKRAQQNKDKYFINLLDGSILDSMRTEGFAKFANDAEGFSNSHFKNNSKITLDDENNVCIMASKKIKAGTEIFCSYGEDYWEKHG